ncbi:uncharacterized protein LOC143230329 isoform X2 [Tachypleus tridentatus]|uniref:uncharacterized protein LOC143230329 isoform X2 n=2 Tax=Tachypleus tridentatus TaxID=6853 RepID=UPI003FD42032
MTVSYQYDVASSTSGGLMKLLFRWRGSVWKMVYRELLVFSLSYLALAALYRFVLDEPNKRVFEKIVHFCSTFVDLIPLSFILGFFVSFTATRWWNQYMAIPWPDKIMNILALYVPGADESSRMLRRTLMRYLNLTLVLVLRSISMAVKRRFPTKDHLVEAGFLTKAELEMFLSVPSVEFNTFWIPCTWFINLLREARQECRITDSNGLKLIMEEFNDFRSKCGLLWSYDWISTPLVYTQVAEQLINPFGDDDEDFELNWIIDRHIKVSYLGVDTLSCAPPPLVRDCYFDETDMRLPYTEASVAYKKKTYRGSVAYMHVPSEQQGMVMPDVREDEDNDDTWYQPNTGQRRASVWTIFGGKVNRRVSPSGSLVDIEREHLGISAESDDGLPDTVYYPSSGTWGSSGTDEMVSDNNAQVPNIKDFTWQASGNDINNSNVAKENMQRTPGASNRNFSAVGNMVGPFNPKISLKHIKRFKSTSKATNPLHKNQLTDKGNLSVKQIRKGVRFLPELSVSQRVLASSMLQIPKEKSLNFNLTSSTPNLADSDAQVVPKDRYQSCNETKYAFNLLSRRKLTLDENETTVQHAKTLPNRTDPNNHLVRFVSLPNLTEIKSKTANKTFFSKAGSLDLKYQSCENMEILGNARISGSSQPSTKQICKVPDEQHHQHCESGTSFKETLVEDQSGRRVQSIIKILDKTEPLDLLISSNRFSSKSLWNIVK